MVPRPGYLPPRTRLGPLLRHLPRNDKRTRWIRTGTIRRGRNGEESQRGVFEDGERNGRNDSDSGRTRGHLSDEIKDRDDAGCSVKQVTNDIWAAIEPLIHGTSELESDDDFG